MMFMMKSIKNYYHINDVPFLLNILLLTVSYSIALTLKLYFLLVRYTTKVIIEGEENLKGNYIYCHWHQHIASYLSVYPWPKNQVWLQHPFWYMKPIHALLSLSGISYVLGSSGNNGKLAATKLCHQLQQGSSTTIFPDGPAGPAKVLKKGILHIAQQSGLGIVAIQFEVKRSLNLSTWDHKSIPLPFNRIIVRFSSPITATGCDEEQLLTKILNKQGLAE